MYSFLPSLILGFHGCDREVAEAVLADSQRLNSSQNDYDWLGHGVYFWEQNPRRALQYAELIRDNPKRGKTRIKNPAVLGAVIHPGYCLNLLESTSLALLKDAFHLLQVTMANAGVPLPQNIPVGEEKDILIRNLDCAVIETLHQDRKYSKAREFDSVRGVFFEGRNCMKMPASRRRTIYRFAFGTRIASRVSSGSEVLIRALTCLDVAG